MSRDAWTLLGLEPGADARSVKRRYAQLLKTHRPDDDPVAFQRLREAYEYALGMAGREPHRLAPVGLQLSDAVPAELSSADERDEQAQGEPAAPPVESLREAPAEPSEAERARQLLEASESLDDAWRDAQQQGLTRAVQLHLLQRCLGAAGDAIETLRWAMSRLNWLTPWQADFLPLPAMERLAERLLGVELNELMALLRHHQEHVFYDRLSVLAESAWLQAFDRRARLQRALIDMLEACPDATAALFDRLCSLFGWDEAQGHLPCDAWRWERLIQRCELQAAQAAVVETLALPRPRSARERATWFLLKPMGDGKRRQMADGFALEDWQACAKLAYDLEGRLSSLPERLDLAYRQDWHHWQPKPWARPVLFYAWLVAAMTLISEAIFSGKQDSQDLSGLIVAGFASVMVILVLRVFLLAWSWLAYRLAPLDVWLSRYVVPSTYRQQGAGLLLLRHVLPALAFSFLVTGWAGELPVALSISVLTFVGSLCLLANVTRGRSPVAWLTWMRMPMKSSVLRWVAAWIVLIVAVCFYANYREYSQKKHSAELLRMMDILTSCDNAPTPEKKQACEALRAKHPDPFAPR